MSRTRAQLDQKLTALQSKVRDLTPRRLKQRYVPEYFTDRVLGGILTLVGLKMAWAQYRELTQRRERRRQQLAGFGRWH
jgi:hypothetical protein